MGRDRKVLVVDDDNDAREEIVGYLTRKGFDCLEGDNGIAALDVLKKDADIQVILTDIRMPGLDGLEFMKRARKTVKHDLEFVVMTGHGAKEHAIQALRFAANDFIEKPLNLSEMWRSIERSTAEAGAKRARAQHVRDLQADLDDQGSRLDMAYVEVLDCLKVAADHKDPETANHIRRIGAYSRVIAIDLGWDEKQLDLIERAAPLHDIGKIGTPDNILLKPGKLTPDEIEVMKLHPEHGYRILIQSNHDITASAASIALSHHEKWDGAGYPKRLKGQEIPLDGRIAAVADVYDALRSERPYKPAFSHEKSTNIILQGDGRTAPEHFDPALLEILAARGDEFDAIFNRLVD